MSATSSTPGRGARVGMLFLLAVVVVGGAIVALAPRPRVTPVAATLKPISLASTVTGSPAAPGADLMAIQTDVQKTHEFASEQFDATGSKTVPPAPAIGDVTFSNHGSAVISVPSGTQVVSDSGQGFLTTEAALVEAERNCPVRAIPVRNTCSGQVPIRATRPGAAGNVPEHSIRRLTGALGSQVTADNLLQTVAGRDIEHRPFVTQHDLDSAMVRARADLEPTLRLRVLAHLNDQPSGRTVLPETTTSSLTASVTSASGDLVPTFTVYVDVDAVTTTIDSAELNKVLRRALAQTAVGHREVVDPVHVDYRVQLPASADGHVVIEAMTSGFTLAMTSARPEFIP